MKKFTLGALAAAAVLSSVPANAAYLFAYNTLTNKNAQPTLSFQLPASPTPDAIGTSQFDISNVSATVCTNSSCSPLSGTVSFFTLGLGGGFAFSTFDLYGAQLWSGTLSAPTFNVGTYDIADSNATAIGQLVISDLGGAVPEPAAWAMMLAGFGGIGIAMRRRPKAVVRFV